MQFFYKTIKTTERLYTYGLYTVNFSESEYIMKTSMFQWVIVCDTKINDIVHDMILFLQVIIIIQRMP